MFLIYNRSDENIKNIHHHNQNETVMDIQHGFTKDIQPNSPTKSILRTSQTR